MSHVATLLLSVVSPVYRADVLVAELVQRLMQVLKPLTPDFEIIPVDDRIPDESWLRIQAEVTRDPRVRGRGHRLNQALEGIMVNSDKPLRLTMKLALLLLGGAFLFMPLTLVSYWVGQIYQPGYASLIISIWFFSGLLLSVLGMVGLYVGKIFEQVKKRLLYLADEETH
jgi:hypothetical protein